VAELEKLLKKKLDLEALEYDEDRPRGRINDGRRTWRERGESGDARDTVAPRSREPRPARAPAPSADPFFNKPYEAPAADAAPSWEASAKPATSRVSANIKTKRKVAALFKAAD
jgi:hypothetical protein